MKKLIIIQTVTPDYRLEFFNYLYNSIPDNFELYGGEKYFTQSIISSDKIKRKKSKNYFFLNRNLLFQTGIWHLLFRDVVLVLELNPRIISNWIFLLVRSVLKRDTIVWGHAWSRKGINSKSEWLRNNMRKMATKIIVYSNTQRKELKLRMPNKEIYAAPNSILISERIRTLKTIKIPTNLIYVGRLSKEKKPLFLVKAFSNSFSDLPKETKLILVGEGEEKQKIVEYIQVNNIEDKVLLKGHISDFNQLKKLYEQSFFSVSPGYIGLSVTQSFGFGVPMIVSKNENHSPEIEAVIPNINALYFETDSFTNFRKVLLQVFKNKEYWIQKREEIALFCKTNYSVEAMAKTFINITQRDEVK